MTKLVAISINKKPMYNTENTEQRRFDHVLIKGKLEQPKNKI